MASNEVEIEFVEVVKQFPGSAMPTLNGMNLKCHKGAIHVLIGHSGAGKSVTLKHVLKLVEPDAGEIRVKGLSVQEISEKNLNAYRSNFGMLFQNSALFDGMTVFENVAFPLRERFPKWRETEYWDRVAELLTAVGLEGEQDKMPSQLSGGMRKRVGLARAICLRPSILLFDEPTTGLDPQTADLIDRLISKTSRDLGATSLIISHDVHAALRFGDFVSMIWEGKIIETATPQDLKKSKHPVVRDFLQSAGAI
jgi:phospholipid/cholesterol/gamma-HCH transport system ATP-binding protein